MGLSELDDATQSVLCEGSALPLRLVRDKLVVGEEVGQVPDSVPRTPLAQDLDRQQRTLRLRPVPTPKEVLLDLRTDGGRARSVLLHRLVLLGVPWGEQVDAGRSTGTFKEAWRLAWEPELAVTVIEAGLFGTTVVGAADAKVAADAEEAPDLATLGRLVEACLTAELDGGLGAVVETLAERTARQHDVLALLGAVEPLARTRRYGDVRGADTTRVAGVLETVVTRASVGLRAACASLDDEAAATMRAALDGAQRGIELLDDPALTEPWRQALRAVGADDRLAPLVSGRVNRLLLDVGELDAERRGSAAGPSPLPRGRGRRRRRMGRRLPRRRRGAARARPHPPRRSSTRGSPVSTTPPSTTCCPCCGAPSRGSRRPSDARSASGCASPTAVDVAVAEVDPERGAAAAERVAELIGLVP